MYVSRSVKCEYCGNQRSEKAKAQGLSEGQYDDLLNFETSTRLDRTREGGPGLRGGDHLAAGRRRCAVGSAAPALLRAELVELGCFIALTMGQQSWLRLLDIEHHEVLAGTAASMAPGFDTAQALAASKATEDSLGAGTTAASQDSQSPRS